MMNATKTPIVLRNLGSLRAVLSEDALIKTALLARVPPSPSPAAPDAWSTNADITDALSSKFKLNLKKNTALELTFGFETFKLIQWLQKIN